MEAVLGQGAAVTAASAKGILEAMSVADNVFELRALWE